MKGKKIFIIFFICILVFIFFGFLSILIIAFDEAFLVYLEHIEEYIKAIYEKII